MRTLIALAAALSALCCAPASAEVYKWVDKNGKIHYSDQPPEGARVVPIQDRLSLYSPEPAVAQALRSASGRSPASALAERVAQLERQLQTERSARQAAAAPDARAAYDRCIADRRTDCDQISGGTPPAPAANRPAAAAGRALGVPPARAS